MSDVTEIDAATGTVTYRDFTAEEAARYAADSAAAQAALAVEATAHGNRTTLTERASTALQGNRDFLALASPTNAQTLAQVKALTQQSTALIRLLTNALDATD